jgi:hypothetical protein
MPAPESRIRWAERQAEELLSVPFIAEFVLRGPQMIDGTQKEVADLLILYKDGNLLTSQKAQEDPLSRNKQKNELWVLKAAKNGVSQLCGALRPSTELYGASIHAGGGSILLRVSPRLRMASWRLKPFGP